MQFIVRQAYGGLHASACIIDKGGVIVHVPELSEAQIEKCRVDDRGVQGSEQDP